MSLVIAASVIPSTANAENCSPEAAERAKIYYNEGASHYRLDELTQAAESFKKSYEACQSHMLLYNIGQTYRLAKDNEKALFFYKQYLSASPADDPYRADVTKFIEKIQAQLAEQGRIQQAPPAGPAPPDGHDKKATRADLVARGQVERPVHKRRWLWPTVVGGVVAIGIGVGLGVGLGSRSAPTPTFGTVGVQ